MNEPRRVPGVTLARLRHELRTPINHILGYSEMLLEEPELLSEPEETARLEDVRAAGRELLALVNEIFRDATSAEGRALEARRLDRPLQTVASVCADLRSQGQTRNAALAEDLARIQSAAVQLGQLVEDALADPATSHSHDSASTTELQHAAPATEFQGKASQVLGRILVVDDDQNNREMLSRRLERLGHTVITAADGPTALQLVGAQPFDLVLLDMMMPGLEGSEVLRAMKSDPWLRDVAVIMLSALDDTVQVVQCISAGADDYVLQPFDPVLLKARIDSSLEKKRFRDLQAEYLNQIEEQRRRADDLLHVIFPPPIVEELKATGTVRPRRHENVAVLFCDVVGFTPFCDRLSPEELVPNLQRLVELQEGIARDHGLQKIKTMGDAFMAAAGLLTPMRNPVLSCIRGGLEMSKAAQRLPQPWQVRVGIHVGPVVAGVLGHQQYSFDLWGDTVNTAARMESHGVPSQIVLSEPAWGQVKHLCTSEEMGTLEVKGKGQLRMFAFRGFLD